MRPYKKILGLLAAVCLSQTAVAVPATPRPITVRQADGTLLTILLNGDEHGHIAMTTDGHPLWFNYATANYEYASLLPDGSIEGCGLVAKEATRRTDADHLFLMKQDARGIFNTVEKNRQQRKAQSRLAWGKLHPQAKGGQPNRLLINDYPTKGDQHTLVLLVEFSDTKFTTTGNAHDYYTQMCNEEGFTHANGANGSVRDFYIASSNNQFRPTFDVVGPVPLPNTCSYYGRNVSGNDDMNRLAEFVYDAVTGADSLVDYSQYDTNGDGYIDNIYIFYAGYGEADSGRGGTIWPHSFSWDEFVSYGYSTKSLVVDGKKMGSYACSQEINGSSPTMPVGIGTISHEFGHVIGIPDLYDVYYGQSTFTPGSYDVMDQGSYNNNQNTPPVFSAYERGELGWIDYTLLEAATDTVSLLPDLKDSNLAYVIPVENTDGREFFVLENRQQKGWDAYIPGHGMLMWHIDIDTTAWANNTVNTRGSHQHVDLVEADNRRTSGSVAADPFPGTNNVTRWTMTSWAGDTLRILDDIEERDGNIHLLLGGLNIKIDTPELTVADVQDSNIVVKWNLVDVANTYNVTVSQDGEPLDGYSDMAYHNCDSAAITGLAPDTEYKVALSASRGSYTSDTTSLTIRTKELVFEKFTPTGIVLTSEANAIDSPQTITATWDALPQADDYLVNLCHHSYDTPADTTAYDFTERDAGLPEGWEKKGAYVSASGMYVEAPSLRLSNNGHYLLMAQPSARIDSLSFWVKGNSTARGTLVVEAYSNEEWTELATYDVETEEQQAATTHSLAFAAADSVRIRFAREAGSLYIDNVATRHHSLQRLAVDGYKDVLTGGATTYTFTGLEAGTVYGFTVQGVQGERKSYTSPEHTFYLKDTTTGMTTPAMHGHSNSPTRLYDLQGRRLQKPQGIYIMVSKDKSVKRSY